MTHNLSSFRSVALALLPAFLFVGCAFDSISLFKSVEHSLEALDDSLTAVIDLADLESVGKGTRHFLQKDLANNTGIIEDIDIALAEQAITNPEATTPACLLDPSMDMLPQNRHCIYETDQVLLGLYFPENTTIPADARLTGYRQDKTDDENSIIIELLSQQPDQTDSVRNLWTEDLRIEKIHLRGPDFASVTTSFVYVHFGGCPDSARHSPLCRADTDTPDQYLEVGRALLNEAGTQKEELLTLAQPITGQINGQAIAATFQSVTVLPEENALETIEVMAEFDQGVSSGTAWELQVARNGVTTFTSYYITPERISAWQERSTGRLTSTKITLETQGFSRTTTFEPEHGTELRIEHGTLMANSLAVTRTILRKDGSEKQIRVSAIQEDDDVTSGSFWHSSRETTGIVRARKTEFSRLVNATIFAETGRMTEVEAVSLPGDEFEANFWITRPGTDCDVNLARPGQQDAEGHIKRDPAGRIKGNLKYCAGDDDIRFANIDVAPGRLPRITSASGGSGTSATRQLDIQRD